MFPAAAPQPPMINTFFDHLVNRVCDFYEKNPTCYVITAIALGTIGMMVAVLFLSPIPEISLILGFTFLSVVPGSFAEFVVIELGAILTIITGCIEMLLIVEASSSHLKASHHILLLAATIALVALGILIIANMPAILFTQLLTSIILLTLISTSVSGAVATLFLTELGVIRLILGR